MVSIRDVVYSLSVLIRLPIQVRFRVLSRIIVSGMVYNERHVQF